MPKMHTSMTRSNRSVPYPTHTDLPTRSFPQDYSSATENERVIVGWRPEDDERLMRLRTQGLNWQPIADNFPPKTANACRKRHERLMEKRNAASWDDGVKIEELARAYLQVREQMWKVLADELNEKWQTVESKCMEKGVKNLTTAGRAARRHDITKQKTPPNQQRCGSEFPDSALCIPMDQPPENANNISGPLLSNSHLPAYPFNNTLPSQRHTSISSQGSLLNNGMQPTTMGMTQNIPMQPYNNYSSAQLYNTTQATSPPYMTTGYSNVPLNHYAPYSQSLNNPPPSNRHYESISASRASPHANSALPPLQGIPRSQPPLSASY